MSEHDPTVIKFGPQAGAQARSDDMSDEIQMTHCPIHKVELVEQRKFGGLFCCPIDGCHILELTPTGARDFFICLARMAGEKEGQVVTSDEIIADWNKRNPNDEW